MLVLEIILLYLSFISILIIKKIIYHIINVILTKAKLFAIRYEINQAIQIPKATYIIVVTNVIYIVQHIFDFTVYPYQLQLITIVKDLRSFFLKHLMNSIKFCDYSSNDKWLYHWLVDKDMKKFNLTLCFLAKSCRTLIRKKNMIILSKIGK